MEEKYAKHLSILYTQIICILISVAIVIILMIMFINLFIFIFQFKHLLAKYNFLYDGDTEKKCRNY